jgi:hypothetical protein
MEAAKHAKYINGDLFWEPRPREMFLSDSNWRQWNNRYANTKIGHYRNGYMTGHFKGKKILLHRVIYFKFHNELPELIDHIDGNPSNNLVTNLRAADHDKNQMNRALPSNNTSGVKGVYWHKQMRKWQVIIGIERRHVYLGLFDSKDKAIEVRKAAERKFHGEFARHA